MDPFFPKPFSSRSVRSPKASPLHGWVLIDKPEGWTSTQVGRHLKTLLKVKTMGHVGTLDPLATGLLPLALGEGTKVIPYVSTSIKEYLFEVAFGHSTETYDVTGAPTGITDQRPTLSQILEILPQFIGKIQQIPPLYSALHVEGKRAYAWAREGKKMTLPARPIEIEDLTLMEDRLPVSARFSVRCHQGTYVRSLAHDLCLALGTRGHITSLRRIRVGRFTIADAFSLDTFSLDSLNKTGHNPSIPLRSIGAVLDDIPAVSLSYEEEERVRRGQSISVPTPPPSHSTGLCLLTQQGTHEAVALADWAALTISPRRLFHYSTLPKGESIDVDYCRT